MTVLELTKRYIATRINVRRTTKNSYGTVINYLKTDDMGAVQIEDVRVSDAKLWFIYLQQEKGKSYSTISSIKSVLKPAFQMAIDDDILIKNPFAFPLSDVIINDVHSREALTVKQMNRFLEFVENDEHYSKYYEGMYILFHTGLRISEFCGLTVKDISFKEHTIHVTHQLRYIGNTGFYIEKTKTKSGLRDIPMTPDVEDCFRNILEKRTIRKPEPTVDGRKGFLFFDSRGNIMCHTNWERYFRNAVGKYNRTHKVHLPPITPHICRHTYCTLMAESGMNPKILQYLMGHANITVTLNVYTHVNYSNVKKEVKRITKTKQS